jgi:acyl-CoA reductase-like NAD-dependent aldehyde dehydrogenase
MKVGDPMDEDVAVGPVVNKAQYDSILEALETAKAEGRVFSKAGPRVPRTRATL